MLRAEGWGEPAVSRGPRSVQSLFQRPTALHRETPPPRSGQPHPGRAGICLRFLIPQQKSQGSQALLPTGRAAFGQSWGADETMRVDLLGLPVLPAPDPSVAALELGLCTIPLNQEALTTSQAPEAFVPLNTTTPRVPSCCLGSLVSSSVFLSCEGLYFSRLSEAAIFSAFLEGQGLP